MRSTSLSLLVALAFTVLGCHDKGTPAQSSAQATRPAASTTELTAAEAPKPPNVVVCTVLETMDSGGYTYLRCQTPGGEKWAAVPSARVAVGDTLTITGVSLMRHFASPTLKREFDEIYFGALDGHPASATSAQAQPAEPGPVIAVKPVPRAGGPTGRTVAELWAERTALQNKPISVRGTVVRVSTQVMGKNWLHLQDGSPGKTPGDNDLVVTTTDAVAAGDVVLVRGVLHTNRDVGGGYTYPVLVEDAKLER